MRREIGLFVGLLFVGLVLMPIAIYAVGQGIFGEYGGHGYGHLLENILPDFRSRGLTEDQFHTMLAENPRRLLPF